MFSDLIKHMLVVVYKDKKKKARANSVLLVKVKIDVYKEGKENKEVHTLQTNPNTCA